MVKRSRSRSSEASGQKRIGRFGWKDQHGSLLSFVADAYLNEMGVTNRLCPMDTTTIGKVTSDPEDTPDALGLADIDHCAQFIRGTKVPPRDPELQGTPEALAVEQVFQQLGCATCHVPTILTAKTGTAVNGGTFVVPEARATRLSIRSVIFCCMTSGRPVELSRQRNFRRRPVSSAPRPRYDVWHASLLSVRSGLTAPLITLQFVR